MPEGPLGFIPRASTFGPFSRETEEEVRDRWDNCRENARDEVDVRICRIIKLQAVRTLESQEVRPLCSTLRDINGGLCGFITAQTLEHFNNPEIKEGEAGGRWLHRFIVYRGRYFDAEVPSGVDDVGNIPMHQRRGPVTEEHIRILGDSTEY